MWGGSRRHPAPRSPPAAAGPRPGPGPVAAVPGRGAGRRPRSAAAAAPRSGLLPPGLRAGRCRRRRQGCCQPAATGCPPPPLPVPAGPRRLRQSCRRGRPKWWRGPRPLGQRRHLGQLLPTHGRRPNCPSAPGARAHGRLRSGSSAGEPGQDRSEEKAVVEPADPEAATVPSPGRIECAQVTGAASLGPAQRGRTPELHWGQSCCCLSCGCPGQGVL